MKRKDLEIIYADFGDISGTYGGIARLQTTGNERMREEVFRYSLSRRLGFFRFVVRSFQNGLNWYNGVEGDGPWMPIGQPEDYIPIRESYGTLKGFVAKTLDRGRWVTTSSDKGDVDSFETSPARYIRWMYEYSRNLQFRANVEKATAELLRVELDRDYGMPDSSPAYAPQFKRLDGLLEVVRNLGSPENGLGELLEKLSQKAKEGFMRDAPPLKFALDPNDMYASLLAALNKLQRSDELREFWLRNIGYTDKETKTSRLFATFCGFFEEYQTEDERREHIPVVLERLQRGFDPDYVWEFPDFIQVKEWGPLDDVCFALRNLTKEDIVYGQLHNGKILLDVLTEKYAEKRNYKFVFTRYTSEGRQMLRASYDSGTNSVDGEGQLEKTVRACLDKKTTWTSW